MTKRSHTKVYIYAESLESVFTLGDVVLNDPEDAAFLE